MVKNTKAKTKIATLALGCFWGPQRDLDQMDGVAKTTVGYTGGSTPNPNYENLGDHTESIQIEYDPAKISFGDLLNYFWQAHDPSQSAKRQYRSAIFYHDADQERQARASLAKQNEQRRVLTVVEPIGPFYPAEDYHQRYLAKNSQAQC